MHCELSLFWNHCVEVSRASKVPQWYRICLPMQEKRVQSLGQEDLSPREENSNPLQYSCLEDSMDRGAWWATVHGVTNSQTRPKWLNTYKHTNAGTVRESGRFYNCFNEEVKTHHVQGIKEMLKWIIKESYFFFPAVGERGGKLDLSQTGWNVRNYQLSVAPTAVKQLRVRKKKKSESNKAEIACYG